MKKALVLIIAILCLCGTHASAFQFNKNDKIVFIGNSITHGGSYHAILRTFLATRYQKNIRILNKGIAGDVVTGVLNRFDKDILSDKPTVAFVMLGMNDVKRTLYSEKPTDYDINAQKEAYALYKEKTEELIGKLIDNNIRIILLTPTMFEESPVLKRENYIGVNSALGKCADFIQTMGNKYDLVVVNFHSIMNSLNQQEQARDSTFTIVGQDRVHPGDLGHFVMGYQLIKTIQKQDTLVAELSIDAKRRKATKAVNCNARKIRTKNGNLSFDLLENSLPFPLSEFDKKGQQFVPFSDELNQEILSITSLQPRKYNVFIDTTEIGTFDSNTLENGLRLDEISQTPQYMQAIKVNHLSNEIKNLQAQIRNLRYVEYHRFKIDVSSFSIEKLMALAEQKIVELENSNFPYKDYFVLTLNNYIKNIGNEIQTKHLIENMRTEMFKLSKPVSHHYRLELIN